MCSALVHTRRLVCEVDTAEYLERFALEHLMYLCGEDCVGRLMRGEASLNDVEAQAEENLRHSFAVVGVVERLSRFNGMVGKRVAYLGNMMHQNNASSGSMKTHSSRTKRNAVEVEQCTRAFADPAVRERLKKKHPELGALVRLYDVALEVEQHQFDELSACPIHSALRL